MNQTEGNGEVEIDLLQLVQSLWKRVWVIILAALIFGSAAFVCTKVFVTPQYKASTTMYVNNKNAAELPQTSVSASDLSASLHLVETYTVFLQSRATLDEVAARIRLPYDYETLKKMVSAVAIENTSAFEVIVTSDDPQEAAQIANTLGNVLPEKISDFIPGSSVQVVDDAVAPEKPFAPNARKNAVLGGVLGMLLSGGILTFQELMDSQIHSADYLTQTYDIPVLAVIPDLMTANRADDYAPGYHKASEGSSSKAARGGKYRV